MAYQEATRAINLHEYQGKLLLPLGTTEADTEAPALQGQIDGLLAEFNWVTPDEIAWQRKNNILVVKMKDDEVVTFSDRLGHHYLRLARQEKEGANLVTAMAEYARTLPAENRKRDPWVTDRWEDYVEAHGYMRRNLELWYLRSFKEFYTDNPDLSKPFQWNPKSYEFEVSSYCNKAIALGTDVFGPFS